METDQQRQDLMEAMPVFDDLHQILPLGGGDLSAMAAFSSASEKAALGVLPAPHWCVPARQKYDAAGGPSCALRLRLRAWHRPRPSVAWAFGGPKLCFGLLHLTQRSTTCTATSALALSLGL